MTTRRRPARPVEIVLTEEDLAAIIEETARPHRSASSPRHDSPGGPWTAQDGGQDAGEGGGATGFTSGEGADESFAPIADSVLHRGIPRPGAVGDAIRRILEATNLDPGRPTEEE
jgi:hypothetical protein